MHSLLVWREYTRYKPPDRKLDRMLRGVVRGENMLCLVCLLAMVARAVVARGGDIQPPQIVRDRARQFQLKTGSINRFVLECVAIAEPAPTYSWYKDGVEVEEMEGVRRVEDSEHSQLDFFSPQEHQAGSYHCEAANSVGRARSAQSRVLLSLSPPVPGSVIPSFTRAPQTEVQTLGSRVELHCEATGEPEPEIVWLKNGLEVARGEQALVIQSLSQQDVANYACNASNVAGYQYKNVIVNILTVAARIKEGPRELLVASKGKDVVLPCRAEGFPVPSIVWSKDGRELEEDEGDKYRVDSGFPEDPEGDSDRPGELLVHCFQPRVGHSDWETGGAGQDRDTDRARGQDGASPAGSAGAGVRGGGRHQ